jgi:hypothetical protein
VKAPNSIGLVMSWKAPPPAAMRPTSRFTFSSTSRVLSAVMWHLDTNHDARSIASPLQYVPGLFRSWAWNESADLSSPNW